MDYEAGTNVNARIAPVVVFAGIAIAVGKAEISRTRIFYDFRPIPYATIFAFFETNAVSAVSEKWQRVVSPQFFFA